MSRCWGAMFFSVFGGAWMALAHYAAGRLTIRAGVLVVAVVAGLIVIALRLQRRGKEAGKDAFPDEQKRNHHAFGWVNAVTWTAVFLFFLFIPRIGYADLEIPAVAVIVGLHFFPMPPLYRHRANLVTGALMVMWAALCTLIFRGDARVGAVAAGSALILWFGAAWALRAASGLLRSAGF